MTDDLIDDLERLVEEYEEMAAPNPWSEYGQGVQDAFRSAGRLLEALIEEHKDE